MSAASGAVGEVRLATPRGRWIVVITVLGSGIVFLDSTVVNVALPTIGRDFHTGLADLQWILDSYLLTLGALVVLGGSLGDLFGRRRMLVIGLTVFALASAACGLAPNAPILIVARAVQGAGGALLVPGCLAILSSAMHPDDRGRAIGAWSGLSGAWTAIGPFLGGWLVDDASWRLVFLINPPAAALTIWWAFRHVPESRDDQAVRDVDYAGALSISIGLAGLVYALIEGPVTHFGPLEIGAGVVGVAALVAFPLIESRRSNPMVPLEIFRSSQFTGANLTTFAVYGALSAAAFILVVHLQRDLGYSALSSGLAFLPSTLLMVLLSTRAGALAQRIGPRLPMTIGPLVAAIGLLLLAGVRHGSNYFTGVLPGVFVFGLGLTLTVAPLTSAVLAAVEERHLGVGSAINNAIARIAGLMAVALLPAVTGLATATTIEAFQAGYARSMVISAVLCGLGSVASVLMIRRASPVLPVAHAHASLACADPAVRAPAKLGST
jgi:EmrB/QacA subfamily drug resistance transporter